MTELVKWALTVMLIFGGLALSHPAAGIENTRMENEDEYLKTRPMPILLDVVHRGGAPGDPAVKVPEAPRTDFIDGRGMSFVENGKKTKAEVCLGSWWDFFDDGNDMPLYPKPYMTSVSFECGRVKAEVTSGCVASIASFGPKCDSVLITLDDGRKRTEHFIFNDIPIGNCACYVSESESWLAFMGAERGHVYYTYGNIFEERDETYGRFDYFRNTEYLGTFDPMRIVELDNAYGDEASSFPRNSEENVVISVNHNEVLNRFKRRQLERTEDKIPGLKMLAHPLKPFQESVYGSDEAYAISISHDGSRVEGKPYAYYGRLYNSTVWDATPDLDSDANWQPNLYTNYSHQRPLWPLPRRAETE